MNYNILKKQLCNLKMISSNLMREKKSVLLLLCHVFCPFLGNPKFQKFHDICKFCALHVQLLRKEKKEKNGIYQQEAEGSWPKAGDRLSRPMTCHILDIIQL